MRGNDQVIGHLNDALQEELTAVVQYVVHAHMMENFGFKALGDYVMKQAIGEMRHAETLIERILFLEGAPTVDRALAPKIGNNVKAQFQNDLDGELRAVRMYNEAKQACADAGDHGTADLFKHLLKDEEEHVDYLETQIDVIGTIGLENYLAQQLGKA